MPELSNVRAFVIETAPPHFGGKFWHFIKLETTDGLEGWGETAILGALNGLSRSYEQMVSDVFETYLKGESALDRERLYQNLYDGLTCQHPDYVALGVISAFDTALWDLCGKHFKTPVYNLLGGKIRDKVRAYTYIYDRSDTQHLLGTATAWQRDPEHLAQLAIEWVDEGFTGLKFDPLIQSKATSNTRRPWDLPQSELVHAEKAVKAVRDAIGDRADILIGTHGQTTPAAAIRLAKRLECFDPLWLEEPCPPENYREMGRVARATSIPVASGERLVTAFEFQNLFHEQACAVAQPDLGSAGGITATKKIATLAEANYVLMAPHVWGGPIITAAAVQIDANIPNFLIQESIGKSDAFFDEIIKEPFVFEDGHFILTDRPGIGVELDEAALSTYSYNTSKAKG